MARRLAIGLVVLGCLGPAGPALSQTIEYRVVVNAANSVPSLSKKQVARLFLKKELKWPSGFSALPADQHPDAPVRERFCREVLDKTVAQVQSYWRRALFSGLDVPPVELASDDEVVEFVSRNAGAIGYVDASVELGEGARFLEVTP